ncbi:hypothetical protein K400107F7_23620 [Agathobaculum massiliense]
MQVRCGKPSGWDKADIRRGVYAAPAQHAVGGGRHCRTDKIKVLRDAVRVMERLILRRDKQVIRKAVQ